MNGFRIWKRHGQRVLKYLLVSGFPHEQQTIVFSERQVALVVAIKVLDSFPRSVSACEIVKVKAHFQQFLKRDFAFSFRVERGKNFSVPPKDNVHIFYHVTAMRLKAIVVRCAAEIRAEFFVSPAFERNGAFQAFSVR
jgi:hypothetical protein